MHVQLLLLTMHEVSGVGISGFQRFGDSFNDTFVNLKTNKRNTPITNILIYQITNELEYQKPFTSDL